VADPILEVRGVSKHFGGLKALTDVNLSVEQQTIHAIIGPNGAGKSTLLNVLIGFLDADEGSIIYAGEPLKGLSPHTIIQKGIARVFQTPQIFPGMTLIENVAIAALGKRSGGFRLSVLETLRRGHPLNRTPARFRVETSAGSSSPSVSPPVRGSCCSMSRRPACRAPTPTRPSTCSPRFPRKVK
jgi:branched-chain amino acid transport system ATP-binding protein